MEDEVCPIHQSRVETGKSSLSKRVMVPNIDLYFANYIQIYISFKYLTVYFLA